MPVKGRRSRRSVSSVAMCEAWAMTFHAGYDFLSDLHHFDISGAAMARAVFRAAAGEAWDQLATDFLAR